MITYETIRMVHEEEKTSKGLTELPENFFVEAIEYLKKKERMVKGEEDRWEIESARKRLEAIIDIRERKIMLAALAYVKTGFEPENMTHEEKKFFESMVDVIKRHHAAFENNENQSEFVAVVINQQLPKFVGIDMRNYGPFAEGDIVTLPADNANLLIERGVAKALEKYNDEHV